MKKDINKRNIVIVVVGFVLLVIILILAFKRNDISDIFADNSRIVSVYPKEIEKLYSYLDDVSCNGALVWDIDKKIDTTKMDDDRLLDLVFKYLEVNDKLGDSISIVDFENGIDMVLGNEFKSLDIVNHSYRGYTYSKNKDSIVKEGNECSKGKYISSLYGYSYNKNDLTIYVNVGIKEDNNIYNLDMKLLGKESDNIDDLLDLSNGYVYTYQKEKGNYYLVSVEKIEKSIKEN